MTIEETIKAAKHELKTRGRCKETFYNGYKVCLIGATVLAEHGDLPPNGTFNLAARKSEAAMFLHCLAGDTVAKTCTAFDLNDNAQSDAEVLAFLDEAASVARVMEV